MRSGMSVLRRFYQTFIDKVFSSLLGIAPNMMLAKVCSDKNKPNGQYRLHSTREVVMEFVQDLPVRKVKFTLLKVQHRQSLMA